MQDVDDDSLRWAFEIPRIFAAIWLSRAARAAQRGAHSV